MNLNNSIPVDPFSEPQGESAFDFTAFLQLARRFYWIALVTCAIATVLGLAYAKTAKTLYRATAEIKAERRSATPAVSLSGDTIALEGATTHEDLKTIEYTFITPQVMKQVIQKLDLLKRDNLIASGRHAADVSEEELIQFLINQSKTTLVPDTRLIQISFEHRDPAVAQELANAIAQEGTECDRTQRANNIKANVTYLEDEAKKLADNLTQSEKELNNYTRSLGSVSIDQQLNIVADKLRDLNLRSTQAKSDRFKIESAYAEIQSCNGDPDKLIGIDDIRTAPAIISMVSKINEHKGNFAKLQQRYRSGHPFMNQAQMELNELETSLKKQITETALGVEAALASAKYNEEAANKELAEQEQQVLRIRDESVRANVLQRQIEVDRLSYEATLKRLNEELSQTRTMPVLLQVSSLATYAYQVSLQPKKILTMSIAGGLFIGIGIIALLAQLDSSIKSIEAAENLLGIPVIATVPKYTPYTPKTSTKQADARTATANGLINPPLRSAPIPALQDKYSTVAEAFRTLGTFLQFDGKNGNFILLTSSVPEEGTSFCALNLAVTLAQSGLRTLLVDANLRRPALETQLFTAQGHYGIADFLMGSAPLSSIIRSSGTPNLDVVTAGSPTSHPVEVLSRARFRIFLEGAQPLYDRIIVDSSAVNPVSDTLCIARFFSMVCLVMRAEKTSKNAAQRAIHLLGRAGIKPSGLIMNFAQADLYVDHLPQLPSFPEIGGDTESGDFPKTCQPCGKVYETLDDYLAGTSPQNDCPDPDGTGNPELQHSANLFRKCTCGAAVMLPSIKRRDNSGSGMHRRQLFNELLRDLQKAGLPREEARTKLLLTLKIWRNEVSSDAQNETSEAGHRRRELFNGMLDHLVAAGHPPEEGRAKLLQTIKVWREAP